MLRLPLSLRCSCSFTRLRMDGSSSATMELRQRCPPRPYKDRSWGLGIAMTACMPRYLGPASSEIVMWLAATPGQQHGWTVGSAGECSESLGCTHRFGFVSSRACRSGCPTFNSYLEAVSRRISTRPIFP